MYGVRLLMMLAKVGVTQYRQPRLLAQLLGPRENVFVLEAKFLRNVVNTDGHKSFSPTPTGMCLAPAY